MSAQAMPAHAHGRKASWFELFFDLVFVVAVAQLSGAYAHHFDWGGASRSAFLLLALWWCWLGQAFHATRFDQQRPEQRALGLAQILAVCLMAYGVSEAFAARGEAFAAGVASFKCLLALTYWREWRWVGARGLVRRYLTLYLVQAALWGASAALAPEPRHLMWLLCIGLDLASPWWVARYTATVQPHPEHLPERFGLFTIILLGEGMASVVHALDHGTALHAHAVLAALGGAALSFMAWLGYFELTRAHRDRKVEGHAAGRSLRLWAYGHVPLYVGLCSMAAGTVALAGDAPWTACTLLLHAGGVALIPLGLMVLRAASVQTD